MRKRIVTLFAIVAVVALIVGCLTAFVGCNKTNDSSITVWGPQEQQETLKTMVQKFKEANSDITLDIKVGVCAEGDAFSNVSKDPSAAADVFAFANDQLVNFLTIGALAKVGGQFATDVRNNNTASTVGFAEFGGELYGYPYASDNTYFMYYDKSIFPDATKLDSLENILSTLQTAGKKIGWEVGNGWYDAAWFFAFNGRYNVTYNDDFTEKEVTSNFADAGQKATKAMRMLAESGVLVNASVDSLLSRFGSEAEDDLAVGITGSWNAPTIQEQLGANYGVAQLPTVTVDNQKGRISPFLGGKLYGVNATSKHLTEAHKLAAFLAGEEMQKLRFEKHNIGPSNKNVAALDEVKQDPITSVIAQETAYGVAQMNVPQKFWDPMKAYAQWVVGTDYDASQVNDKLVLLADQIADKLPPIDEAKRPYNWHIIGSFAASDWKTDKFTDATKMTKQQDGTWQIEMELKAGNEYKAIKVYTDTDKVEMGYDGFKWSNGANQKIEADGTYTLTYNPETDTWTAVKK